jgi:hypothetical protein
MNPPITNAGASLTDAQIEAAVPLLEAGVSVRALAAELGCSKHSAAVLLDAHAGRQRPPRTKKPKAPKAELDAGPAAAPPRPPWAGVTQALATREREPEPKGQPFEDLQRTKRQLAEILTAAIHRNDRESTSAYSLALARLDKTADPGVPRSSTESDPNMGLIPNGAFEFNHFACRAVTPQSDGGGLSGDDMKRASFMFAGFEALSAMYDQQRPIPGLPVLVSFATPDALVLRTGSEREKPGSVGARIQDIREAPTGAK